VATADTRFLFPGYQNAQASNLPISMICPRAGTVSALYVRHNADVGNGNPVIYRVRVAGFDTPLTVTLATGVIGNAVDDDPAHAVQIAAGQLLEVVAVKSAPLGTGAVRAVASVLLRSAAT